MHRLSLLLLSLCAVGSLAACSIKTSFGCFRDNSTSRVLPYVALERAATWEECAAQCQQMGLTGTAGVENGGECWCSDLDGARGSKSIGCTVPCSGNPTQSCGGKSSLAEFSFSCSASRYTCRGQQCVADDNGTFPDASSCQGACGVAPSPAPPAAVYAFHLYDSSTTCALGNSNAQVFYLPLSNDQCRLSTAGMYYRFQLLEGTAFDLHTHCNSDCSACQHNFYGVAKTCMDVGGGASGFVAEKLCLGGAVLPQLSAPDFWLARLSVQQTWANDGYKCGDGKSYSQVQLQYVGAGDGHCAFFFAVRTYTKIKVSRGVLQTVGYDCTSDCSSCNINYDPYAKQCFTPQYENTTLVLSAQDLSICADLSS